MDVIYGLTPKDDARAETFDLSAGDSFVIPPGVRARYSEGSEDLELLEVSLPGKFETFLID